MSAAGRRLLRAGRLAPAALATWAAAALVTVVPEAAAGVVVVGVALIATGLALTRRRSGRTGASFAPFVAVCGILVALAAMQALVAEPAREAVAELGDSGTFTMRVRVVGKIEPSGQLRAFDGETISVPAEAAAGDERDVAAPVVVRAAPEEIPDGADIGAVVDVEGTAFAPGGGDRAALVVRAREIALERAPGGVLALAATLRSRLVAATTGLPQPGAGLVPGLAVGDTSAVSESLAQQMIGASLSHLTAVSGANCALVVGCVFSLAAVVGASRRVRVCVSLCALAGFVVLVSPEPSVVRAAVMAAVAMIAVLLGRRSGGLAVLSLSVAAILAIDPWLAGSIGFALSVAASAALLVLAAPMAAAMERAMPRVLALAIAVPLAAQLACAPLIVLIDPRLSLVGVLANVLAAPAAPLATVLGVLAALVPFVPVLQAGLAALAWLPAAWIAGVAGAGAAIPGATIPWAAGLPGALALALVGTAIVAAVAMRGRRQRRIRLAAIVVAAVVAGGIGGTAALTGVLAPLTVPTGWSYAACDVGQGDAILVSSGESISLIDTGPDPAALRTCLQRFGVTRLDVVVLTHFDLDHVGGVAGISVPVGTVLHGPISEPADAALVSSVPAASIAPAHAGMVLQTEGARWRILWPRTMDEPAGNDASVVAEVTGDGMPSAIFLGDLGALAQQRLRASGVLRGRYDVVKVSHHGSADQDDRLYDMLDARLALVSVGAENTYGHPAPSLLAMLRADGTLVRRTDQDGELAVTGDPALSVWRERVGAAE